VSPGASWRSGGSWWRIHARSAPRAASGCRGRRRRRARQRAREPRPARGRQAHDRPPGGVAVAPRGRGSRRAALQSLLLRVRRLARSGARRHLERDRRLVLHAARDARFGVPARRRHGDLSRGVRPSQPLDGSDRGQHQQPLRGASIVFGARARALHQRVRIARSAPLVSGWCCADDGP
jgi:hypothetical protein